jgi:Tfp pilus assembly protein PilN
MKAVNLIPVEERGGASAGRSGGIVYVLLAGLATLAVLATTYGFFARASHHRARDLAEVTARADAADAIAKELAPYVDFAGQRKQRTQTVMGLAATRTDWARVLREVARTMPSNAWLTSLHGTDGAAATSAAGASGPVATPAAATAAAPSVEIGGCTTSQAAVSQLMVGLRRIDGIDDVRLSSSSKGGAGNGASPSNASSSESGPCSGSSRATFSMTLTFKAASGAATTPQSATAGSTP